MFSRKTANSRWSSRLTRSHFPPRQRAWRKLPRCWSQTSAPSTGMCGHSAFHVPVQITCRAARHQDIALVRSLLYDTVRGDIKFGWDEPSSAGPKIICLVVAAGSLPTCGPKDPAGGRYRSFHRQAAAVRPRRARPSSACRTSGTASGSKTAQSSIFPCRLQPRPIRPPASTVSRKILSYLLAS